MATLDAWEARQNALEAKRTARSEPLTADRGMAFNSVGFLSRFVGDVGRTLLSLPRGLGHIGGAIGTDIAELATGGNYGGKEGTQSSILQDVLKPLGKSMWGTVNKAHDLTTGLLTTTITDGWDEAWRQFDEPRQEFFEAPGEFLIEHVGNVAIGAGSLGKLGGLAARAGAGTKTVAQAAAQGSKLARGSQFTSNIVGRPYRATARAAKFKFPAIPGALPEGQGARGTTMGTLADVQDAVRATGRFQPEGKMATPVSDVGATPRAVRGWMDKPGMARDWARKTLSPSARFARRSAVTGREQLSDHIAEQSALATPTGRREVAIERIYRSWQRDRKQWEDRGIKLGHYGPTWGHWANTMDDATLGASLRAMDDMPEHMGIEPYRERILDDIAAREAGFHPDAVEMYQGLAAKLGSLEGADRLVHAQRILTEAMEAEGFSPEQIQRGLYGSDHQMSTAQLRRIAGDQVGQVDEATRRGVAGNHPAVFEPVHLGVRPDTSLVLLDGKKRIASADISGKVHQNVRLTRLDADGNQLDDLAPKAVKEVLESQGLTYQPRAGFGEQWLVDAQNMATRFDERMPDWWKRRAHRRQEQDVKEVEARELEAARKLGEGGEPQGYVGARTPDQVAQAVLAGEDPLTARLDTSRTLTPEERLVRGGDEASRAEADVLRSANDVLDGVSEVLGQLRGGQGRQAGTVLRQAGKDLRELAKIPGLSSATIRNIRTSARNVERMALTDNVVALGGGDASASLVARIEQAARQGGDPAQLADLQAQLADANAAHAATLGPRSRAILSDGKVSRERLTALQIREARAWVDQTRTVMQKAEAEFNVSAGIEGGHVAQAMDFYRRVSTQVDELIRAEFGAEIADQLKLTEDVPKIVDELLEAGIDPRKVTMQATAALSPTGRPLLQPNLSMARYGESVQQASKIVRKHIVQEVRSLYGRTASDVAREAGQDPSAMAVEDLAALAKQQGWVKLDADNSLGIDFSWDKAGKQWVPAQVVDAINSYTARNGPEQFLANAWNPATRVFKAQALVLAPRWYLNNALGGATLAQIVGQVSPLAYLREMSPFGKTGRAIQLTRLYQEGRFDLIESEFGISPGQVDEIFQGAWTRGIDPTGRGTGDIEYATLTPDPEQIAQQASFGARTRNAIPGLAGRAGGALNRTVTRGYRLNATVDNYNRAAIYIDQLLRKGNAHEEALAVLNKALGNFRALSPFEKTWMAAVFPFYGWTRTVLGATMHMLEPENITRTVAMTQFLHLMAKETAYHGYMPDYAAGDIHLGETAEGDVRTLSTRGMNPWADLLVPLIGADRTLQPTGYLSQSNPIIQAGIESTTGVDLLTKRPFSTPVPRINAQGQEVPARPGFMQGLKQSQPLYNMLAGVVSGKPRYGTGEEVALPGAEPAPFLQRLGGPFGVNIRETNMPRLLEQRARGYVQAARAQQRYAEQLEAGGEEAQYHQGDRLLQQVPR